MWDQVNEGFLQGLFIFGVVWGFSCAIAGLIVFLGLFSRALSLGKGTTKLVWRMFK